MRLLPPKLAALTSAVAVVLAALVVAGPPVGPPPAAAQAPPPVDWGDPLAPAGATRVGDAPGDVELDLFFGLVVDQAGLEAHAGQVSDPGSPGYGAYLPVAELAATFGASAAHRAALVEGWLAAGTAVDVDVTGSFATATATVAQAEQVLGITYGEYAIDEGGTTIDVVAPDALPDPVPAALAGVAVVRGLDGVVPDASAPPAGAGPLATPLPSYPVDGGTPTRTGTPDHAACAPALALVDPYIAGPMGFTPDQILTAHGVTELHDAGLRGEGTRLALVEAGPFQAGDLEVYADCFGLPTPDPVIHGSQPENANSLEASLDIQVLAGVVPAAERIDVFLNPLASAVDVASFLSAPLDLGETGGAPPDVVSVSYGYCEALLDDDAVLAYAEVVLATAAAAGIGYYVAAGDSGSSGCYHNDPDLTQEATSYPGTSAWVTTVGGTNLTLDGDNRITTQGVWNDTEYFTPPQTVDTLYGGGGGTSTFVARPAWQAGPTVPAGPDRLVPDVALYADTYPGWLVYCTVDEGTVCAAGGWAKVGGTSAATPLMAGMAALATQATREAGVVTPGFASPLLYQLAADAGTRASVFRDVTLGGNDLFGVGCCSAAAGFDLASGWGSVDGAGLVAALVPTPPATTTLAPTTTTSSSTTTAAPGSHGRATPRYTG
jgi:subtilase family serine protease